MSFDVALLHLELRLGASWYHAPGRWDTSDGCVPIRVVWAWFAALDMARALDALDTSHGIGLAFGADEVGRRARMETFDAAFPAP